MNKTYLVIDGANLFHRTFYIHAKSEIDEIIGLAYHSTIVTLNKYYKLAKPDQLVIGFERPNWRKEYTKTDACVSKRIYKANRRQNLTPMQQERWDKFKAFMRDFEQLIRQHTSIVCLAADGCEADDLVAGFVQMYGKDNRIEIVSSDKDLLQLIPMGDVVIHDPVSKDFKKPKCDDFEYLKFEMFVRGDIQGENIQSAYPKVRATRIRKAYEDPFERANMMEERWINPTDQREMKVGDLFEENRLLMDLTLQPDHIRTIIKETIEREIANPGKYSHFHFLKFLGQYDLRQLSDQLETFVPLLSKKSN